MKRWQLVWWPNPREWVVRKGTYPEDRPFVVFDWVAVGPLEVRRYRSRMKIRRLSLGRLRITTGAPHHVLLIWFGHHRLVGWRRRA